MRILVLNNLTSGLQDGSIYDFIRKLAVDGDEIVLRLTDGNTGVATLLEDASDFELIVAAGGDGTIAAICYALRYSDIPILAYPAGTGNLLATNLDLPDESSALANAARQLKTCDYDLGEIEVEDANGGASIGFAVMAGAGYDADIIENAHKLKAPLGQFAYVAAAISNPKPQIADFTLTLDEGVVKTKGIACLLVNFSKISPDVTITHNNDAQDGMFELVILKTNTALELLPALIAAFLDRDGGFATRFDAMETYITGSAIIESDPPLSVQHDGESTQIQTPIKARVLKAATRMVIT